MITSDIARKSYTFKAKGPTDAELLIYSEIGDSFWGDGVTAKQFSADLKTVIDAKTLNVRINSPGGSVFEGTAIYNQLKRFPGNVVVDIDGLAASIASVIALAGNEVRMASNALYMIHDPSGIVMGSAEDMRKMADTLDLVRDTIVGVYHGKTQLSQDDLAALMTAETWMGAEEAKAKGFVDTITGEVSISNKFDLSKFKRPPQAAQATAETNVNLKARLAHMAQRVRQLKM